MQFYGRTSFSFWAPFSTIPFQWPPVQRKQTQKQWGTSIKWYMYESELRIPYRIRTVSIIYGCAMNRNIQGIRNILWISKHQMVLNHFNWCLKAYNIWSMKSNKFIYVLCFYFRVFHHFIEVISPIARVFKKGIKPRGESQKDRSTFFPLRAPKK